MLNLAISRFVYTVMCALFDLGRQFFALFSVVQEAHATAERFETLARMSDTELAHRGLKRDGLAQAVLADAET